MFFNASRGERRGDEDGDNTLESVLQKK